MCDPYLAGIYGRKFERSGWDVDIEEDVVSAERHGAKSPPHVLVLDIDCVADPVAQVKELRSLPTLMRTRLVLLAREGNCDMIDAAMNAGADSFLLIGHFVPQEAVDKMHRLLNTPNL